MQKEPPSHIFALLRNENAHKHKSVDEPREEEEGRAGDEVGRGQESVQKLWKLRFKLNFAAIPGQGPGEARTWSILAKLKFMNR